MDVQSSALLKVSSRWRMLMATSYYQDHRYQEVIDLLKLVASEIEKENRNETLEQAIE